MRRPSASTAAVRAPSGGRAALIGRPSAAPLRRVLVPSGVAPALPALGGSVHALSGRTMGTTWSVRLVAAARRACDDVARAIQAECDDVVAQMSTWAPSSDLCRFDRAEAGSWQALPPSFFEVMACGLAVARLSDGAFDPAVGALVDAWGFGARPAPAVPPDAATIARARALGGWRRLELDTARRALRQPGGLRLDLSAIAKGHAVDRVAGRLDALGIESHLVEIGGELRGTGIKPDGQPWWVAIEPPAADARLPETLVALHGLAVATSGDYRRGFDHAGRRHGHTIDPRDGWPVRHGVAAVTVLHPSCMEADAWSTALGVLGPDDGLALAQRRGLAALFVLRGESGFEERASSEFLALAQ